MSVPPDVPIPAVCRSVLYMLSEQDVKNIDAGRAMFNTGGTRIFIGNRVEAGQVFPMTITRVWDATPTADSAVNGQVLLDGNDTLWAMSVTYGAGPGHFTWPVRS